LGADRTSLAASDASAAALRDALADVHLALPRLGGDAEILAGRELACPEPDGWTWDVSVDPAAALWLSAELLLAWAELDRPVAARSAAQSCAAQVAAGAMASAAPVVELESVHSATELVLPGVQSWLAELACAHPGELLAYPLWATSRSVLLEHSVELALPESRSGVAL
jgi:hypothetical protein